MNKFRLELRNRFTRLHADDDSINEEWKLIKVAYTETSLFALGHNKNSREDWLSQATWQLINELHLKLLGTNDELGTTSRFVRKSIAAREMTEGCDLTVLLTTLKLPLIPAT
ncbi:unnamed protein product [Pieris macdunnoughi]|uniref:Uncharacterized protein n=1 Tax=Pieris macdunnoughi TaxID=345717 RepID=A0A821NTW1_9NEOP|nr:unnamed protein product [Pieris macdunnoughi]